MHHYRAEHWIVVSGTALVERDDEEQLVSDNKSCFIHNWSASSSDQPGMFAAAADRGAEWLLSGG
jgi:quercetin dioxygenase-like cupin family protein